MKYLQRILITCIATVVCFVIGGGVILGSKADRSVTGFEYPEVPGDYPYKVFWQRPAAERAQLPSVLVREQELLSMVMVKLWSEGDHDFTGGVLKENGTFYPLYPEIAYVEWDQNEAPDGTVYRYVSRVLTTSENDSSMIMDQLNNGETPEGIRIVDYKSAGINSYEFLSK